MSPFPSRGLPLAALLLLLAVPAPAQAAPHAVVIYGDGLNIKFLHDLTPAGRAQLAKGAPDDLKVGWAYERFHIYWADLWTWDGRYVIYSDSQLKHQPVSAEEIRRLTGKTVDELGTPFLYRYPLGLLIIGGIILLCVVASLVNRGRAPAGAPPAAPGVQITLPDKPTMPVHSCFTQLYQPDEVMRARVPSPEPLVEYLKSVDRAMNTFAFAHPCCKTALSVFVALRPGGRSRFWVESRPEDLAAADREALLAQLHALPAPEVQGLVAAANYYLLRGGPENREELFAFVPREWAEAVGPEGGVLPDDAVNKVWPE